MDVKINDRRIKIPSNIATWGNLLDWIETSHLKSGQCITHVLLAGYEMLNYRDPVTCDEELDAVGHVEVKTGDFDDVMRESMEELDRELKSAITLCGQVVLLLKSRKEQEGYDQLAELLDLIRIFYTVFSEDLGWGADLNADFSRMELSVALDHALTQLIAAQEDHYGLAICEVIESEIFPILESWQGLVDRTRPVYAG